MNRNYRYTSVQCPKCKRWVTFLWFGRHFKSDCAKGGKLERRKIPAIRNSVLNQSLSDAPISISAKLNRAERL